MNFLFLDLSKVRSQEFLGSEPNERATWVCLLAYCADQENSGTIKDCAAWGDRKWQQIVGVTAKEVRHSTDLFWFDGDDLCTWGYPIEKQSEVQINRLNGKKGGRPKKADSASGKTETKPSGYESVKPKQNQVANQSDNQVGKPYKNRVEKSIEEKKENISPFLKTLVDWSKEIGSPLTNQEFQRWRSKCNEFAQSGVSPERQRQAILWAQSEEKEFPIANFWNDTFRKWKAERDKYE